MVTATALVLSTAFVLGLGYAMVRAANRARPFLLVGGPYDGETVHLEPDTETYITNGERGSVLYVRCPAGHLHLVRRHPAAKLWDAIAEPRECNV